MGKLKQRSAFFQVNILKFFVAVIIEKPKVCFKEKFQCRLQIFLLLLINPTSEQEVFLVICSLLLSPGQILGKMPLKSICCICCSAQNGEDTLLATLSAVLLWLWTQFVQPFTLGLRGRTLWDQYPYTLWLTGFVHAEPLAPSSPSGKNDLIQEL